MLLDNLPNASTQLNAIFQAFPDMLFTLDEKGIILDYKAGGDTALMLFSPPQAFLGQQIQDVLPRELVTNLMKAVEQSRETKETVSFEYSLRQADTNRWFEARLVPAPRGQVIVVIRDATRHKQAEEKFKFQLQRLAPLRAIDMAIFSRLDITPALFDGFR